MVDIVIADKIYLIRQGLKSVIEGKQNRITGEISNQIEFWPKIKALKPDVLILGYDYEDIISISDLSRIKDLSNDTKLLIISGCKEKDKIFETIKLGVSGYLSTECDSSEISKAIETISKGEKFFCNKILDFILEKNFGTENKEECKETLTEREVEIIKLITEKYSNQEIADKLFISIHTVYTHRKNVMKKLQLKSPVELVLYAIDSGIVVHT